LMRSLRLNDRVLPLNHSKYPTNHFKHRYTTKIPEIPPLDQIMDELNVLFPIDQEDYEKRKANFESLSTKQKFEFIINVNRFLEHRVRCTENNTNEEFHMKENIPPEEILR